MSPMEQVSETLNVYGPIHRMIRNASQISGVGQGVLLGDCRDKEVCMVRWAIMWAAHSSGETYMKIARVLRKDRTTIKNGIMRAKQLLDTDSAFAALCDALETA